MGSLAALNQYNGLLNSINFYYSEINQIFSFHNASNVSGSQYTELAGGVLGGTAIAWGGQVLSSKAARLGALWLGGQMISETCNRHSEDYNATCKTWYGDTNCALKKMATALSCAGQAATEGCSHLVPNGAALISNLVNPFYSSDPIQNMLNMTLERSLYFKLPLIVGAVSGSAIGGLYLMKSSALKAVNLIAIWAGDKSLNYGNNWLSKHYEETCQNWYDNTTCFLKKGATAAGDLADIALIGYFYKSMLSIATGIIPHFIRAKFN